MTKLVYLLVCLAVFVNTGSALKCYTCHSDKADGCKENRKPDITTCGKSISPFQAVCAYKVLYESKTKQYQVSAGCEQISEGSPLDKRSLNDCDPSRNDKEVKECRVCNTDLCNSAPVFSASLFSLLCLPVMYFFTKFVLN